MKYLRVRYLVECPLMGKLISKKECEENLCGNYEGITNLTGNIKCSYEENEDELSTLKRPKPEMRRDI